MTPTGLSPTSVAPSGPAAGRRVLSPLQRVAVVASVVIAVLCIGSGTAIAAVAIITQTADTTSTVHRAITTLDVVTDGDVSVVAGPDNQVTVATHETWSLTRPTVTQQWSGDTLTLTTTCPTTDFGFDASSCASFHLSVPTTAAVTVHSDDGDVSATGLTGPVDLQSGDGDVSATDLTGPVQLTSTNGAVSGSGLRSARAGGSSSNGDVSLAFDVPPASVTAASDNGDVAVTVPTGAATYFVDASTVEGSRSVGVPSTPSSNRHITASSHDGDVSVAYSD